MAIPHTNPERKAQAELPSLPHVADTFGAEGCYLLDIGEKDEQTCQACHPPGLRLRPALAPRPLAASTRHPTAGNASSSPTGMVQGRSPSARASETVRAGLSPSNLML